MTDPQPEYQLLLDAVLPHAEPKVNLAAWESVTWGRALEAATWHRVAPLLYTHLLGQEGAPPAVMKALERAYLASAARNMFVASAVDRVVSTLHAAGVPALLLKGAALVETVYDDPAHREMLDIDVLVPRDRLPAANAALSEIGFRAPGIDTYGINPNPHHDPALIGEEELVAVELHHHIAIAGEGRPFVIDGFWERARPPRANGHQLPSASDLLLHVCLHFTRNRLGGSYRNRNTGGALAQIGDIARIAARDEVDWDGLVASAEAYGLASRVYLALFAARALGAAVPAPALGRLSPAGFDPQLGLRLVQLRVLRGGDHMPVRSVRHMLVPSRDVLARGWNADPSATMSLAAAYLRRVKARAPEAREAMRRPWTFIQDQRLNSQLEALEEHL